MSFFRSLFGMGVPAALGIGQRRNPNPADAAQGYLAQVPAMAQQQLSPYVARGNWNEGLAANTYNQMFNEYANPNNVYPQEYTQMAQNPMGFVENIMRNYEPSTGYRYKEGRMRQAMRNSAASGGFAGTELDRNEQADAIRGMLGEDMQQFIQNILGVQGSGLSGRERGMERGLLGRERALARQGDSQEAIAARGYDASRAFADLLSGNASERGSLAFQGQRQRNQDSNDRNMQRQNFMSNLIGIGMGR